MEAEEILQEALRLSLMSGPPGREPSFYKDCAKQPGGAKT